MVAVLVADKDDICLGQALGKMPRVEIDRDRPPKQEAIVTEPPQSLQ
jgi:hypothetical protein